MATEETAGLVEGPNDLVALLAGILLVVIGSVGFIGVLLDVSDSFLRYIFYLATGALGIVAGPIQIRAEDVAAGFSRPYNKTIGIVYLLVFALGVVSPTLFPIVFGSEIHYDVLHLSIGLVLTSTGFMVE